MLKIKETFILSAGELKHTKTIATAALLIAVNITLDVLNIRVQISPDVRIGFGFLCNAAIGMLFGPAVAMLAGAATDVMGYLVNTGGGAYFPGYTLTAIVAGVFWGFWLYKKPVKLWRTAAAKACINIFCNIGLNTIWTAILLGNSIMVILPVRIAKNLILLPFEVVLLFTILSFVQKINGKIKIS
ncbi:MAG: folate family ECF transporter S component [Oscillospiraceae bacterium]